MPHKRAMDLGCGREGCSTYADRFRLWGSRAGLSRLGQAGSASEATGSSRQNLEPSHHGQAERLTGL